MSELIANINGNLRAKFAPIYNAGVRKFDFLGGRRSGKTFFICQYLLKRCAMGDVVNVATMTSEQGRLGAYADCCTILNGSEVSGQAFEILRSPREIRYKYNNGRIFFNSYQDSETAKGIACDWLYINEANNFTERQYIDLSASVRKGVFADRNPNAECWTETNGFAMIHSSWKDNAEYLTPEQRKWFETLKAKAESKDATQADIAFYRMYYLGEYAEIAGAVFTPTNIQVAPLPDGVGDVLVFCDPSALRGADYFACVLGGIKDGKVYIIDTYSPNMGDRPMMVRRLLDWCKAYEVQAVYIETNGIIGQDFYDYAINSGLPAMAWYSRGNKYDRIIGNYQNIITQVVFADTDNNKEYLRQVYAFDRKCEHDDNIDAVNSLYNCYKWSGYL